MARRLTLNSIVSHKAPEMIKCIQNEIIAFNSQKGRFYEFNEVGNFIIQKTQKPISVRKLLKLILAEFEVEEKIARKHLLAFIKECVVDGILKTKTPPAKK